MKVLIGQYQLKPCPFCGERADMVEAGDNACCGFFVRCNSEHCVMCLGGLLYSSPDDAAENWNKRISEKT